MHTDCAICKDELGNHVEIVVETSTIYWHTEDDRLDESYIVYHDIKCPMSNESRLQICWSKDLMTVGMRITKERCDCGAEFEPEELVFDVEDEYDFHDLVLIVRHLDCYCSKDDSVAERVYTGIDSNATLEFLASEGSYVSVSDCGVRVHMRRCLSGEMKSRIGRRDDWKFLVSYQMSYFECSCGFTEFLSGTSMSVPAYNFGYNLYAMKLNNLLSWAAVEKKENAKCGK